MDKVIHRAESRGRADHGWLRSYHTFSFAGYHNPERMHFGKLRVLNDDVVEPGQGFGAHSHSNMEIITIPLSGALQHKDNMGNVQVIHHGEVQAMSAGTGISHSEYNHSDSESVNFLQIWMLPQKIDTPPRYEQKVFKAEDRQGRFQLMVSPDNRDGSIRINQEAYFSYANLAAATQTTYHVKNPAHGVYLFVIEGCMDISGERLEKRDAMGLTAVSALEIAALTDSQILCIETPAL